MPKALGEFINDLALKAGIGADDENLKSILASPELLNIKVNDDLVTAIDKGLLNIDAAKNNHPDIKKKYFADAYDGVDKFVQGLIDDDNFSSEDVQDIKNERSTTKKIELITNKLKAAKGKADPTDKAAINKQIADLNELVRVTKEEKTNTVKEYENKIKDIKKEAVLNGILGSYKTIYDDLPQNVKHITLNSLINQALQDNDAELSVGENGALNLVRKDGSNVFGSDHRQHTPKSFLDKTLAPILKNVQTTGLQQQSNGVTITPAVPGITQTANTELKSLAQRSLADMESAEKTSMM